MQITKNQYEFLKAVEDEKTITEIAKIMGKNNRNNVHVLYNALKRFVDKRETRREVVFVRRVPSYKLNENGKKMLELLGNR